MQTIPHNKVLNRTPPEINKTEQAIPHYTTRLLAQLRTNKSPILQEYPHKTHQTPLCHSHTKTHFWLSMGAHCPGPRGAMGRSIEGGGAAGPLVVVV